MPKEKKLSPNNNKLNKMDLLALAIIIGYALFFCFFQATNNIFPPYLNSGDDAPYSFFAKQFLLGTFRETSFISSVRILQILPIAFFYKLFGTSYYSAATWNILSFIGAIIVAFFIGKELYNKKAGLLSALLFTFFPLVAELSYTIKPIVPLVFISSLSILGLIYCQKRKSKSWGFLAGMLLIATPLLMTIGFVMVILLVLYLVADQFYLHKIPTNLKLYIFYGMLLTAGLTAAFNYIFSGNPLITLTATAGYYSTVGCNTNQTTNANLSQYNQFGIPVSCSGNYSSSYYNPSCLICYMDIMFPYTFNNPISFAYQIMYMISRVGLFFYALLLATVYLIIKREKRAYYLILWFVSGFLYLSFGAQGISLSPLRYTFINALYYYLAIIAMPTIVITSIALVKFLEGGNGNKKSIRLFLVLLIVLLLIISSLYTNYYSFATF